MDIQVYNAFKGVDDVIDSPIDDEIETSPIVEVENTTVNYLNNTN